jgi:hypothetical protein
VTLGLEFSVVMTVKKPKPLGRSEMIIAVDFVGTCVTHGYPDVGKEIGAVLVLKWLIEQGHEIILWTTRGRNEQHPGAGGGPAEYFGDLADAIKWFAKNGIPLYGINGNPTQKDWTKSPKAYANIYIDDTALGCPLVYNPALSLRPFVNWKQVEHQLRGIFEGRFIIGG